MIIGERQSAPPRRSVPGVDARLQHRIVEDSTMDSRRFRRFQAETLARARWWGWAMIMTAVLVQVGTARS